MDQSSRTGNIQFHYSTSVTSALTAAEEIQHTGFSSASHLHQRLLRQLGGLEGYSSGHVGCDGVSEAVARTRGSLEDVQVGARLRVAAGEGARRADRRERACRGQGKKQNVYSAPGSIQILYLNKVRILPYTNTPAL